MERRWKLRSGSSKETDLEDKKEHMLVLMSDAHLETNSVLQWELLMAYMKVMYRSKWARWMDL